LSASLIIVSGPGEGDYYPITDRVVVVGRDEHCEIQILDELISRRHLQVAPEDGSYKAMDMGSSNGVIVNGRPITGATPLADGDMIELGNTKLMFAAREFPDRKTAWDFYKLGGERGRSTLIQ
jgi:pSer/pThr/pTyr-binding forkhead associated (FHA) protein